MAKSLAVSFPVLVCQRPHTIWWVYLMPIQSSWRISSPEVQGRMALKKCLMEDLEGRGNSQAQILSVIRRFKRGTVGPSLAHPGLCNGSQPDRSTAPAPAPPSASLTPGPGVLLGDRMLASAGQSRGSAQTIGRGETWAWVPVCCPQFHSVPMCSIHPSLLPVFPILHQAWHKNSCL